MLWKRNKPQRHFAQIDERGHCQAFWSLAQPPAAGEWVEVDEANPCWIGRPLPTCPAAPHPAASGDLTAGC